MKLPKDIASCHKIIKEQQATIDDLINKVIPKLITRIEVLENQLNQNSGNSHRPPSSDGPKRKPAFTRKKKGKQGGQPGHKGKTLEMVEHPDKYERHEPKQCKCGQDLNDVIKYLIERRQIFDLPKPELVVTEYQSLACICPSCKKENKASFPDSVKSRVQYGSGVSALITMLSNDCQLSFSKIKIFFSDIFGYAINESTQCSTLKRCYSHLTKSEQVLRSYLQNSPVNHFDETGIRIKKKNYWVHGSSNDLYTYLFVHPKRGKEAINSENSILPNYKGWAVHDCWLTYFKFDKCKHSLCGAHLLRELQGLIESNSKWAKRMHELLLYAYHKSDEGKGIVKNFNTIFLQYQRICSQADQEEPPPEKRFAGKRLKRTKGRNLLDRLITHQDAVLAFAKHEIVPFTNNQDERDIRPAKTKLKVAGCFRSFKGAQYYARIQSFISSARKNQLNIFNELVATFNGYNFLTAPEGAK